MAGKIPQQFIDELISRVDIVDIINARMTLRKAGRDYMACCPFHDEKTPSFSVSQQKQFYYCFGCGASGTAISFLMEYEHMDFVDAVHELASFANMEVPVGKNETNQPRNDFKALYSLLENVANFYKNALKSHDNADKAIAYLKQRGLTGEVAAKFSIGFAPPGWESLVPYFMAQGIDKNTLEKQLLQTGMLIKKDTGEKDARVYDRFRDRIMYPIHDSRGRVIGFGGRAIDQSTPKYLNSPETPIFQKGQELYGLHQVRKSHEKLERLIVVEGYMDVIGLSQYGINNAVATLGTATTKQHLERMFRHVTEVVFCFDGDRAGREAAGRAMDIAIPLMLDGRQARFMFLPEKEDPDSFVRQHGKAEFEARVVNAIPLSQFLFESLEKKADLRTIDGRSRFVELVRPSLMKVPGKVFRFMLIEQLAEKVHLKSEKLTRLIEEGTKLSAEPGSLTTGSLTSSALTNKPRQRRTIQDTPNGKNPSLVRKAIRLLLENPALARQECDMQLLGKLDLPGADLLLQMIELLNKRPEFNSGNIIEHWRGTREGRALEKLLRMHSEVPEVDLDTEYLHTLNQLKNKAIKQEQQRQRELIASKPYSQLSAEEKLNYGKSLLSE